MNFLQITHKKTTAVQYLCHFVVTFDQNLKGLGLKHCILKNKAFF